MTALVPARPFQVAWVVEDLEAAMAAWVGVFTTGPFLVLRHPSIEAPRLRGVPVEVDVSIGLAQAGALQVELIQAHGDGPSVYRQGLPGGAVHHIGSLADDYDAVLAHYARAGVEIAYEGKSGDMRFVYLDTVAQRGCMTEYLERTPEIVALAETVASASEGWDGSDPVRELSA